MRLIDPLKNRIVTHFARYSGRIVDVKYCICCVGPSTHSARQLDPAVIISFVIRQITTNDVVIKCIREHHTEPWSELKVCIQESSIIYGRDLYTIDIPEP